MQHFLGVMSADMRAMRDLSLDHALAEVFLSAEEGLVVQIGDRQLTLAEVDTGAMAFVAFSGETLHGLTQAVGILQQETGRQPRIALIDLTQMAPTRFQTAIHVALAHAYRAKCHALLQHNLALSRSNSALRMNHMRLQEAFARMAASGLEAGSIRRIPASSFLPASDVPALTLPAGSLLEQRLPGSAAGLCDLAIARRAHPVLQHGTLSLALRTLEDNQTRASWLIEAADLDAWIRLSLPAGLDTDQLTPILQMSWSGQQPLALHQSLSHPDPRYQACLDGTPQGRTLALRSWKTFPGCEVPYDIEGLAPQGHPVHQRLLPVDMLANAVNLTPTNPYFHFVQETGALTVHVVADGLSVALLPDAVGPGSTGLTAHIQTRSDLGPAVEYAMALADSTRRPEAGDPLPAFNPGQMTDWFRLEPMVPGEAHLVLAAPLTQKQDLYLMTRLAEESRDIAYGWSTFSRIRIGQ